MEHRQNKAIFLSDMILLHFTHLEKINEKELRHWMKGTPFLCLCRRTQKQPEPHQSSSFFTSLPHHLRSQTDYPSGMVVYHIKIVT